MTISQPKRDVEGHLFSLAALSVLVGSAAGLVGAVFRLLLERADRLRDTVVLWAGGRHAAGLMLVIAMCALSTALAAWLVRRFSPHASGSGIPFVEAMLDGRIEPASVLLIPVKFVGGLLSIGSGMALGREGPSVQLGAAIGYLFGRLFRQASADCRALLAGGAGAGLATAFNAPIAGAVFVLEELVRRFDTRIAIATFGASAGAIAVGRIFLGDAPDFHLDPQPYPGFATVPIHLALGGLAGLAGVAYNLTIVRTLDVSKRLEHLPVQVRAGLIGAMVGALAWFAPGLVGGGDALTQRTLDGGESLAAIALVFLIRFGLGPLCYAARTPGGLFAPLLVLGAQLGLAFGLLCAWTIPYFAPNPQSLAVVGMAALFTAVVRAPLTGIILIIELTGSFTLLLPMLSACFAAMAVATLLRNPPIYDSLRETSAAR